MKSKVQSHVLVSLIKNLDYEMLSDTQWDELKEVDLLDQKQLSKVLADYVGTEYGSMDTGSQDSVKENLRLALSDEKYDFNSILTNLEIPFGPISDGRSLFLAVWETMIGEAFRDA
ncbi:MAG TPA: hypothetical protein VGD52_04025 [Pseudoduganella sp.]